MTVETFRAGRWTGAVALAATLTAGACAPAITTEQEVQLGREYSAEINRQLPIVQNQAIHYYINQLGNTIARRADPRGIEYTFYVVNSDAVNAFAVPGGFIYVNRGLIERADNLSELAGVVAHEIGHVVERHSVEQLQKAQNANLLVNVLYGVLLQRPPSGVEQVGLQVGGGAIFAGYSRDAEREADEVAVPYLMQSGIHPIGLATFFEQLMAERQRNPGALEQWFSTHPTTEERIQRTRASIAAIPDAQLRNLQMDSQAFQEFRQRVRQLPPAPAN